MDLNVDPERLDPQWRTGIWLRAKLPDGTWDNVDLFQLDKPSLLMWLRQAGGNNPIAENTVGILLGHGHLHEG